MPENISTNQTPTVDNIPKEELQQSMRERQRSNEQDTPVEFLEWSRLLLKMIDSENSDEELRRVRKITKMMRYYRGEQRGFWSSTTGDWIPINPDDFEARDGALLLINNQIRPQVKSLAKEWCRSRARMKGRSTDDTTQKKGAARYATGVLSLYQDRLMPESLKQIEAKSALLAGNYLRYTYFDKNAKRHIATVPRISQSTTKAHDDFWWCPDCDHEGSMDELQTNPATGQKQRICPQCKGKHIQMQSAKEKQITTLNGYDKQTVGDPATEIVDVREVKVHLRARSIQQTPYLRRRRYVLVSTLKRQYPWANIKPSKASAITRYIQETELSSGTYGGQSRLPFNYEGYGPGQLGTGLGGMTEYPQLWIRPSLYYDLKAKKDLVLGDNTVLKQGDRFIEKWPDGLYIAFSGDDLELVDVRNEIMDAYWSHGSYDPLIESFWGDGLEDLIQMQELVNETQSLFIENLIYNASPKIIYNPWMIEASMFSGNPSEMTPLSRNAKRDTKPQDVIYQLSGMSMIGDVPNAQIAAINDMRTQSGAYLAMSGSNDPKLTTATAMAIARDAAVSQLGPPLALKAECDVVWAYQVLRHIQDNWVDGVHDKLLGNYTLQEAKWFKECDLERDIEIVIEPGSWTPRTDLEIRNDFLSFITAGGIPLGFANPQVPYEIKQQASELFRMPIQLDKLQPDIRIAEGRIEQVITVAELLMDKGLINASTDNDQIVQLIVADVPVDTYIDDHPVMINTYQGWLKTDQGQFAPVVVRGSIEYLIQAHREAEKFLQDQQFQEQAQYAAAAQALQGMVENETKAQDPQVQAQMAEQEAANQPATEPIPLGTQSERPTTNRAKASSNSTATSPAT